MSRSLNLVYIGGMHDYKQLSVWQRGIDVVELVYQHTASFPKREWYGITSQIRRAAVSIPSNVAEGAGRRSNRDFARFLSIAAGSCNEVVTLAEVSLRLGFMNRESSATIHVEVDELRKMIDGLARSHQVDI